ncbi:MAG: hypothetical protein IPP72_18330 [Chitinophagaceae bacterium]|nr:hypothetical protein [Chitinophagaceae bacterium]
MKRSYMECSSLCRLLMFPVLAVFFYSCDTYNFSHPQPVDKVSMYEFPNVFHGNWLDDDSEVVLISKNYIGLIMNQKVNVVRGIWPRKNEKEEYVYLSPTYKGFSSIIFDSLQKPIDTVANYVLNADHIYEVTDKEQLEQGYHYSTQQDTFTIIKKDTMLVDLGHNAFLKDIGDGFFVMNIRNQVLGQENRWWQLFVMEKKQNDRINIWYCSYGLTQNAAMFYEKQSDYYFNSQWTAAEMRKLIQQGAFEMCNQLQRDWRNATD